MTNSELKQAQEWAEVASAMSATDRARAAINIIKSLPDQWIDAEKLREALDDWSLAGKALRETDLGKRLEALLPANLPTLADMTQEEREACQFMQARLEGSTSVFVIADSGRMESRLWTKDGATLIVDNNLVTPLSGEPKLKWPGSEPQPSKVSLSEMWVDDGRSPVDALKLLANKYEELDRIKPEDVPADELWLVEYDNHQWLGKRNREGSANYPWRVASLDGDGNDISSDSRITLIHKLVPETHTLPKGMRLADHEEYGRVVVSPEMDSDNEYKAFYPDQEIRTGADWEYVHENNLTFLDGDEK